MMDEKSRRSAGFRPGPQVRLSDGQLWTLSRPDATDPAFAPLFEGVGEAQNDVELRRAELAASIFWLGQNYDLEPADLERLLTFSPRGDGLVAFQGAVHQAVVDAARNRRPRRPAATGPSETPAARPGPDRPRGFWAFLSL